MGPCLSACLNARMFSLRLVGSDRIEAGVAVEWDGVDDVMSISIAAGQALENSGTRFLVGGFGDLAWPVDVYPELSIVIEQLPDILRALRERQPCDLNFYEQGIERTIDIIPNGEVAELRCHSRTDWIPNPAVETAPIEDLLAMFESLSRQVADAVFAIDTDLGSRHPFSTWRDSTSGLGRSRPEA